MFLGKFSLSDFSTGCFWWPISKSAVNVSLRMLFKIWWRDTYDFSQIIVRTLLYLKCLYYLHQWMRLLLSVVNAVERYINTAYFKILTQNLMVYCTLPTSSPTSWIVIQRFPWIMAWTFLTWLSSIGFLKKLIELDFVTI